MSRITAWREASSGLYRLYGETYHKRGKLKEGGARWNPEGKYWLASRELAEAVGADIMMRVRVPAHCHMRERMISVGHRDVERGYVRLGCPQCDTSILSGGDVVILEVFGECTIGGGTYKNANPN